jgi:hypothetical protein
MRRAAALAAARTGAPRAAHPPEALQVHHGREVDALLEVEPLHVAVDGLADEDGGLGEHGLDLLDGVGQRDAVLLDYLFREAGERGEVRHDGPVRLDVDVQDHLRRAEGVTHD